YLTLPCGCYQSGLLSLSSKVHQTPIAILKGSKDNVQLTCNHTIQNYNTILWYQQSTGDTAMKLIGFAFYKSITMEKSFEKHFNVSGDGSKEAYLHLVSLRSPEDSAVYYCAASQHSDVENLLSSTKTLADRKL
uniref:Ig-like domain-containing protein n=1 Tax=Oncorhynchus tshawytscha TaxID=74940 RepID=A0A8C8FNG9_ONCTS